MIQLNRLSETKYIITGYICLLFLLMLPDISSAQYSYPHYNTNKGLLTDVVHFSMQDANGYLWFASDSGIIRYDGHRFRHFTTRDGLGGNENFHIFEDSQSRLWFLSFNGIPSYYKNGEFFNPDNDQMLHDVHFNNMIVAIFEDNRQRIWIIGQDHAIFIVSPDAKHRIISQAKGSLRQGWTDSSDNVFIGSSLGTWQYFEDSDTWTQVDSVRYPVIQRQITAQGSKVIPTTNGIRYTGIGTDGYILSDEQLGINTTILYANRSRSKVYLAVGTYGDGIHFFIYDGKNTRELITILLPGETVTSVLFDTQQSIWVTTLDNGVFRIDRGYEAIRNPGYSLKLPDTSIRSGIVSRDGYIWLGTRTGWVYAIDPNGELAWSWRSDLAPTVSSIESLFEKPDSSILVGSASGLFGLNPNTSRDGTSISPQIAFFEDQTPAHAVKTIAMLENDVITGTNTSLVRYFNDTFTESETIANQRITDVLDGPDESVWVGTTRGLYRYYNEVLEICGIPFLLNTQINSITRLWGNYIGIATYGEGVIIMDVTDNSYHIIDADQGLSDNLINTVKFDGTEYLWVATSAGLNRISLSPYKDLGPQIDRLPSGINIYSGSLFDMQILHILPRGDQVWLGGSSGLFTLMKDDPGEFEQVIPLHIEEVFANGEFIPLGAKKEVHHDQNEWSFNFTGILFRDNQRLNYRYRLQNKAERVPEWSITQNTGVSYRSVPPGDYIFEVQAFSTDGKVVSETVHYEFRIKSAWWMLPWVWLIATILIISSVILTFHTRVRQVQRKEKEKNAIQTRINELELQALQAMMNPHFVFNILNNIRYQILLDDKEKASDLLVDFSKLIRMQLDTTYKRQISISEEIERLKLYVMMESVRILHPIHLEYSFAEDVDPQSTKIPSMLLQPFVENAIIHGIIPKNHEGTIKITIKRAENRQLNISICDDGTGIKDIEPDSGSVAQDRLSLGTILIKERLGLMAKEQNLPWEMNLSNITNQDGEIGGVCVHLLLPIV